MTKFLSLLAVILFSVVGNGLFSQMENPEDKVRSSIRLEQKDCDLFVVVDVDIIDGWHINSHILPEESFFIPTNVTIERSPNYKIHAGVIEPKPIMEYDEDAEEMLSYHHHKFKGLTCVLCVS